MKLTEVFCAVPVIGFAAMAAFADDATRAPESAGPWPPAGRSRRSAPACSARAAASAYLKSHEAAVSAGCKAAIKEASPRGGSVRQ